MRLRGFTLIELLVVIAIIGIISAIIIATLNAPRAKGADAAIREQMHSMSQEAELYYYNPAAGNNTYGIATNSCTSVTSIFQADANIKNALQTIANTNGLAVGTGTKCNVNAGGAAYAITAQLSGGASTWWCIDSNGANKAESGSTFNAGLCQ